LPDVYDAGVDFQAWNHLVPGTFGAVEVAYQVRGKFVEGNLGGGGSNGRSEKNQSFRKNKENQTRDREFKGVAPVWYRLEKKKSFQSLTRKDRDDPAQISMSPPRRKQMSQGTWDNTPIATNQRWERFQKKNRASRLKPSKENKGAKPKKEKSASSDERDTGKEKGGWGFPRYSGFGEGQNKLKKSPNVPTKESQLKTLPGQEEGKRQGATFHKI